MAKTVTVTDVKVTRIELIPALGHDVTYNDTVLSGDQDTSVIHYDLVDTDGNVIKNCNTWKSVNTLSADSKKLCDDYKASMINNMKSREEL